MPGLVDRGGAGPLPGLRVSMARSIGLSDWQSGGVGPGLGWHDHRTAPGDPGAAPVVRFARLELTVAAGRRRPVRSVVQYVVAVVHDAMVHERGGDDGGPGQPASGPSGCGHAASAPAGVTVVVRPVGGGAAGVRRHQWPAPGGRPGCGPDCCLGRKRQERGEVEAERGNSQHCERAHLETPGGGDVNRCYYAPATAYLCNATAPNFQHCCFKHHVEPQHTSGLMAWCAVNGD